MRQDMLDGSEGEHDQAERGVGGVEAVGAVDDQAYPAVQAFVSGVGPTSRVHLMASI